MGADRLGWRSDCLYYSVGLGGYGLGLLARSRLPQSASGCYCDTLLAFCFLFTRNLVLLHLSAGKLAKSKQ